jgi:DNA-binding NarL/FixJ family response regulator
MLADMINVTLADHERIFRIGMASALAAEDDIRIVGQPRTPEQLIRGLRTFRPHVLVLSSAFLRCIDSIQRACSRQQTAILLLEDYDSATLRELDFDVQGVMRRSADEGTILHCIRHLARGGRVLRLSRGDSYDGEQESVGLRVRKRLSTQELSIVSCVVQGHKNRDIARRLGMSEQSVKNALRKIFDKTGVFGRLELALFVLHHRTLVGVQLEAHPASTHPSIASLQRHWDMGRRLTIQ